MKDHGTFSDDQRELRVIMTSDNDVASWLGEQLSTRAQISFEKMAEAFPGLAEESVRASLRALVKAGALSTFTGEPGTYKGTAMAVAVLHNLMSAEVDDFDAPNPVVERPASTKLQPPSRWHHEENDQSRREDKVLSQLKPDLRPITMSPEAFQQEEEVDPEQVELEVSVEAELQITGADANSEATEEVVSLAIEAMEISISENILEASEKESPKSLKAPKSFHVTTLEGDAKDQPGSDLVKATVSRKLVADVISANMGQVNHILMASMAKALADNPREDVIRNKYGWKPKSHAWYQNWRNRAAMNAT